jgi:hypothetical protein
LYYKFKIIMKKYILAAAFFVMSFNIVSAQDFSKYELVIVGTDTMRVATFDEISIVAEPVFASSDAQKQFQYYQRCASDVYPYAVEAVRIYKEVQYVTETMGWWERRSHIQRLQKELKEKFEDKLINLSKTRGKILVKMIERKLNVPLYDVISSVKGDFTAGYWTLFGNVYGYKLRRGYIKGDDKLMDMTLPKYEIMDL